MFHGTSARSYCWAEASAQPARSRAWFENGPSRWTRSNACLARSKLPDSNRDRKSTRLNSSHGYISYAVFCLKKKNINRAKTPPSEIERYRLVFGTEGITNIPLVA